MPNSSKAASVIARGLGRSSQRLLDDRKVRVEDRRAVEGADRRLQCASARVSMAKPAGGRLETSEMRTARLLQAVGRGDAGLGELSFRR